jgi:O-antigen/teichoic acid export membrane protein
MDGGLESDVLPRPMAISAVVPGPSIARGSPGPAADCGRPVGPAARLAALVLGKHTLALIDQAVVSGTNFLTTILIARACGAEELGVYSLGFSLLMSWVCTQEALIALPYTIYWHRSRPGTEAEYAGSALVHQGLLSAVSLISMALVAATLFGRAAGLAAVIGVLAGAMPFVLLREFGRRFAFAHLRMGEALALDVASAALQLGGLAWLASTGALSAALAYSAVGGACALVGITWLYVSRKHFVVRLGQVGPTLRQSWSLGRWLFASQVTLSVQGYFIPWLLAGTMGAKATGVYVACLTVVLFSNPLILGISNSLAPQVAQAFALGGFAALRRVVWRTTLLLGAAMAVFCAAVILGGEDLMGLIFHDSQYAGHNHAVAVLALAMLAAALGMPVSNGLAAIERPDVIFKVGLVAVVLSVVLVPFLVVGWGVTGAAYGFLAGHVAGSAGRWLAFAAIVRRSRAQPCLKPEPFAVNETTPPPGTGSKEAGRASVKFVLQQFTGGPDNEAWEIEQFAEGAQASLFSARRRDGRPIWQVRQELAIKVYKSALRQQGKVFGEQVESLARFHAILHDRTINGWHIHVPTPLFRCESPLALVMTLVPGRSLNASLETIDESSLGSLEPVAQAVVAAMECCWSIGHPHGDLNFDNILCDPVARSLSFVDPGIVENDFLCEGVSRGWYPASRDLAYLLYDTGVSVKKTLGKSAARKRQERLVEQVLRAFAMKIDAVEGKHRLLDEIHACVRVHLSRIEVSWSLRGIWLWLLLRVASRRIDAILDRLRADASLTPVPLPPESEGGASRFEGQAP